MIEPLKLLERNIDRFNRAEPLLAYAAKGLDSRVPTCRHTGRVRTSAALS